ncbi:MAG: 2-oxoacid:acceptor oxidoreductase subunit alpha [Candidatus Nitrosopelagicus brevis]|nr:2-oxoacid:acceptor oxidoreductase subunit alpha [Candidatus Nitrosopelagicus brevis]
MQRRGHELVSDFTWMIGGPQGSGVETAANIFSQVFSKMGYQIFGKREYYSNIKGEHSYFAVRVSDKQIRSSIKGTNMLIAFDAETIFRHANDVLENGIIIYDSTLENIKVSDVITFDNDFKERMEGFLKSNNKENTIKGILELASERGASIHSVSFRSLLFELSEKIENPRIKTMIRMFNVLGVSLSLGLLMIPTEKLTESINSIFSKKKAIADMNVSAANFAYNYAAAKFGSTDLKFNINEIKENTLLVQGYYGTSIGKIIAGCRFQSYYPITPATDESNFLETNEILEINEDRPGSTLVIQTEDEISAIGMAIGSSLTGVRSATCTSGPGFVLMIECLSWAGINEVPVVITFYQRSGPSTGLPTRHGQDDLLCAINSGVGEFPRIVYASGNVSDSFYDTANVFNYADVFQVPIIHMMDKFIASSVTTCQRFDETKVNIDRGKLLDEPPSNAYKRFDHTADGLSPRSKIGLENGIFWNTGDESDVEGHISEDPVNRVEMMDKRQSRLDYILEKIPESEQIVKHSDGEFCVVSWGSTQGPILDAIDMLKNEGINIGFVEIKLLHPFPKELLKKSFSNSKTIIDVEANYTGQLGSIIKQNVEKDPDYYILKYTGRPMTCTELYDTLKKIVNNNAEKREVLTYGA